MRWWKFWLAASSAFLLGMVISFGFIWAQIQNGSPRIVVISTFSLLACGLGAASCAKNAVEVKERED